jgi:flagellar basal-body rod protein FlgG
MIQSLYSASTGMDAQQLNLNTISNNLANANTTGFKRSKIEFQDLIYQSPKAAGSDAGSGSIVPTSVEVGSGTRVVSTSKIFTQGELKQTSSQYDLAISGDGFLEVKKPDGTSAYTRDGALKTDDQGNVTTSDGLPVQSGFQPIPSGTTSLTIAPNGTVTVQGASGTTPTTFKIQLTRFNNPSGLQSDGGNLYDQTQASGDPQTGNPGQNGYGTIVQNYLESSNVNVVEEMVNMIQAQRAYEINSKSIQTSDEMLQQMSSLKR